MFVLPGRRALLSICLLLSSCFLAACGGGGDTPAPVVNEAPVAHDVAAATHKNGAVLVSMNGNDPEALPLAFAVLTPPGHGALGAVHGNTVLYTAAADFTGTDSFTYRVTDGASWSAAATARLTVTNSAPVAAPLATQNCSKNCALQISLDGTDLDGDLLDYEVEPASLHGGVITTAGSMATYVPATGFTGSDGFSYRCSDGTTASAWTSVAVDVANDAPLASSLIVPVAKNLPAAITLVATDGNGDALAYEVVTPSVNGATVTVAGDQATYTPPADFTGTDLFTFRASDGALASPWANVTVAVANQAPTVQALSASAAKNVPAAITLRGGDPNGDALVYEAELASVHGGTVSVLDETATYTAPAGFTGTDSFAYRASDGAAWSTTAAVTVLVENTAPVSLAATAICTKNRSVAITLAATDGNGDALSFTADGTSTQGGTIVVLGDVATYTAPAAYTGTDSFAFRASDGDLSSPDVTATITVLDGEPVAEDGTAHMFRNGGSTSCTMVATDPDGDALVHLVLLHPLHGTLGTVSGDTVVYTPDAGWAGTDAFTFVAHDGKVGSNAATCTITVENRLPVASDASVSASKNATTTVSLVATDADGDALTYAVSPASAQGGTVTVTGNVASYRAPDGYEGGDSFTFTANDGLGNSNTATMSLQVAGFLYVKPDAMGAGDGSSWENAFTDLQAALAAATEGDTLWIAAGTYLPSATGDRRASFILPPAVRLHGGFAGTETELSQADPTTQLTVLSGDIGTAGVDTDNSRCIVVASEGCRLDGLTVSGGRGESGDEGAGLRIANATCTIHRCLFSHNTAGATGSSGAIAMTDSHVVITDSSFRDNGRWSSPWVDHGAALLALRGSLVLRGCSFENNAVIIGGGDLCASDLNELTIESCHFQGSRGNIGGSLDIVACGAVILRASTFHGHQGQWGGALSLEGVGDDFALVENCVFAGSSGWTSGSELHLAGDALFRNCTFYGLGATSSVSMIELAMSDRFQTFQGCIFANPPDPLFAGLGPFALSHCLLPAYSPGTGNVAGTPLFVDPADLDGPDDRWATEDDGLHLRRLSPGVDGADPAEAPATDVTGRDRNVDEEPDMGAYEYRPPVLRVRKGATGAGDGSSWADAFPELRDAIAASATGDEIWVAAGTYLPTADGNRATAFVPASETSLYGGFAGTETERSERDAATNLTILSGDIGVPDEGADDSYTILEGQDNLIDGFTFTRARADGASSANSMGGALYLDSKTLTVRDCSFVELHAKRGGAVSGVWCIAVFEDCRFRSCTASTSGGAAHLTDFCWLTFQRCTFEDDGAPEGGALSAAGSMSRPFLVACELRRNVATGLGGALRISGGATLQLQDCALEENRADRGGALSLDGASATLEDCRLLDNQALSEGGALVHDSHGALVAERCVFARNDAPAGAALHLCTTDPGSDRFKDSLFHANRAGTGSTVASQAAGAQSYEQCSFLFQTDGMTTLSFANATPATLTNCLLWNPVLDTLDELTGSAFTVSYSCVRGGAIGTGNVSDTPLFVDESDADGADDAYGTADDGLMPSAACPCVDRADLASTTRKDLVGTPRPQGSGPDMGCYERP